MYADVTKIREELGWSVQETAVGYDDPHMMMSALDESIAYEDDIHAERGALKARYDNAIATANEELERALPLLLGLPLPFGRCEPSRPRDLERGLALRIEPIAW